MAVRTSADGKRQIEGWRVFVDPILRPSMLLAGRIWENDVSSCLLSSAAVLLSGGEVKQILKFNTVEGR